MYADTLDNFASVAEKKAALIRNHPLPFLAGAMMAGAYIGLGCHFLCFDFFLSY